MNRSIIWWFASLMLLFTTISCENSSLDVQEEDNHVKLDSNHDGWKMPDCWACHSVSSTHTERNYTIADNPAYTCVKCHGVNGASPGHSDATPCSQCHQKPHSDTGFPDPLSCQTCHPKS
ncbi:hypothetical protein H8E77_10925 [bacterium]|nr:hypothetical protein [bacterium]